MSKYKDDFELDGIEKGHGKKPNQKLKSYFVMQYLLKHSDEDHLVAATELVDCPVCLQRSSQRPANFQRGQNERRFRHRSTA